MRSKEKKKYFFVLGFLMVMVIFIVCTLFEFYRLTHQRIYEMQIEEMKNLSMQGCAVVEKKLEGFINLLYGLTDHIQEEDVTNSENMEYLRSFLDKRDVGFQRMGIADAEGNAVVTNGEMLNISDRNYFHTCIEEKRGVTEIRYSDIVDKQICIVAVPILNNAKEAIGMIYGVSELDFFRIYDNTVLEGKNTYIQIVDFDGNYIRKKASTLIGKRDNIFEGIGSLKSQISVEKIKEIIQNDEQVYTEVTDGENREIVYFTPLKLNDWCVVSVIDFSEIRRSVDYMLNRNAYAMVLKIALAMFLLFLLFFYYSRQERKRIKGFNEKLLMDEEVMLIAAEKTGLVIMNYGMASNKLRFINRRLGDIEFPEEAQNLSEAFMRYFPNNQKLHQQLQSIFEDMKTGRGKRDFLISFAKEDKEVYLRI